MSINITPVEAFNLTINGQTATLTRVEIENLSKALHETLRDNIYLQEMGQQHTRTRSVFLSNRETVGIWKKPDGRILISNLFGKDSIFDRDSSSVITLYAEEAWKIIDSIKEI